MPLFFILYGWIRSKFGTPWPLAFPKTKITFEREEIWDPQWDSRKYDRAADGDWEKRVRSQGAYFEGDWGILSHVQYFLYLVFYSINVSTFHSKRLDTFWTDVFCVCVIKNKIFQNVYNYWTIFQFFKASNMKFTVIIIQILQCIQWRFGKTL